MTNRLWQTAIDRAGVLAAPLALDELPDAELLRRFLADRAEPAFAALVRRHGPLVWGVCRHLLQSEADAEDAFQATFLALVRGAGRIARPNALGAWLHRVAGRVCRNSLRSRSRRARHERIAAVAEATQPVDGATWDRWQLSVHEEIDRLPEALRVPFVLCVLQGVRQPEAARRLGWKLGTVSGRVCKAKQALTDALTKRGLTGPVVLMGLVGVAGPLSAGMVARGTTMARLGTGPGGDISPVIHELARGATGVLMSKTKLLAATVLTATLAIGIGSRALPTADAQIPPPPSIGARGGSSDGGPPVPGGDTSPAPKAASPRPAGGAGAGGSGGMMGGSVARGPRVEYHFVARPKGADAFKKLLTQQGADGWEYVGQVPGDDELIFKRLTRPGGITAGGMIGPGGMPGGTSMPGGAGLAVSPGSAGDPVAGRAGGFGSGFGGGPGLGGFGTSPAPKGGPGGRGTSVDGGPGAGAANPFAGPGAPADNLTIREGETIRHKMKTNETIDGVHSDNSRSVEVTLDPTDPKRVLIRGLNQSRAQIELTDEKGTKERYTVRVR